MTSAPSLSNQLLGSQLFSPLQLYAAQNFFLPDLDEIWHGFYSYSYSYSMVSSFNSLPRTCIRAALQATSRPAALDAAADASPRLSLPPGGAFPAASHSIAPCESKRSPMLALAFIALCTTHDAARLAGLTKATIASGQMSST